jgi:hypothetical protein
MLNIGIMSENNQLLKEILKEEKMTKKVTKKLPENLAKSFLMEQEILVMEVFIIIKNFGEV